MNRSTESEPPAGRAADPLPYEVGRPQIIEMWRVVLVFGIIFGAARGGSTLLQWFSEYQSGSLYNRLVAIYSGYSGARDDFVFAVSSSVPALGGLMLVAACALSLWTRARRRLLLLIFISALLLAAEPWTRPVQAVINQLRYNPNTTFWEWAEYLLRLSSEGLALSCFPLLIALYALRRLRGRRIPGSG